MKKHNTDRVRARETRVGADRLANLQLGPALRRSIVAFAVAVGLAVGTSGLSRAGTITVAASADVGGPLPIHIYALTEPAGIDIYPLAPPVGVAFYLFGVFDTGSTSVRIGQGDAGALAFAGVQTVNVRLNGLATVDPVTLGAPIGPGAAQAEVLGVKAGVAPLASLPTLIGTPVANQVAALIDNTATISRTYSFGSVTAPDITLFDRNDPRPQMEVLLDLDRFGQAGVAADGATTGQRYLLRNVEFTEANVVTDDQQVQSPFSFFFDTGTTTTLISMRMAQQLGINLALDGDFDCPSNFANEGAKGYKIDSVVMRGLGGTGDYVLSNAPVCVDILGALITTRLDSGDLVDAVIGANFYNQVPVLFDGPNDLLGIGLAAVPEPSTLGLLAAVGIPLVLRARRRRNEG